jgi:hypothetical protein
MRLGIISTRYKQTAFDAYVHDVKQDQLVGRIVAKAIGDQTSGVVFVLFIFPVPVATGSPSTETAACHHFSELLTRRITTGSARRDDRSTTPEAIIHLWRWEYTDEFGKRRVTSWRMTDGQGVRAPLQGREKDRGLAGDWHDQGSIAS